MPDTIVSVGFRSDGAPANARAGAYPILPSAIVMGAGERVRYSVKYVPGTLTVSAAAAIAFVTKAQTAPTPSGGVVWNSGLTPTAGHTLVLFVHTVGASQAAPSFATPLTGDDSAYTQVGGAGYQAEITPGADYVLAAFYRKVGAGGHEGTVKVTFTDPGGGFPGAQLCLLEYANVAAGGVTAFVKAQVTPGTRPNPLPALDLDNSTGQCVVAGYVASSGLPGSGGVGPDAPAGYSGRFSMAGSTVCDGDDINVLDRVGLSGFGPETVSVTWTPGATGRDYAGIAFALTKG